MKTHFSLDRLFLGLGVMDETSTKLRDRQHLVVKKAMGRVPLKDHDKDIVIDVSKSEKWSPVCVDATPCILPNSKPYRVSTGGILTTEQVLGVQGIFAEDFPALREFDLTETTLLRDLAGNAFSTTVCMAVVISCLGNWPMVTCQSVPSTPKRLNQTPRAVTPPRKHQRVTYDADTYRRSLWRYFIWTRD